MKRLCLAFLLIFLIPFSVYAAEQKGVTTTTIRLREGPSTETNQVKDGTTPIAINGKVIIYETVASSTQNDSCASKTWYKIKGNDTGNGQEYEGYGCSSFIEIKNEEEVPPQPNTDNKIIDGEVVAYGTINNGYVYSEANTASALRSNKTTEKIAILGDATNSNSSGCKDMYKILYSNMISYACKSNFKDVVSVSIMNTDSIAYDYATELAKFPANYRSYIEAIHKAHPNWRFYAINTNLNFNDVVANEQKQSYLDGSNNQGNFITLEPNYYNWKTNTWTSQDSGTWYVASKEAIEYYVDPRKYLNEKEIFVFEDSRAYTYQTDAALQKMVGYAGAADLSISYDGKNLSYFDAFKEAAKFSKVSALTTLARSRVETGKFTSNSVSGREFEYNGSKYSGYYNYYNIGAWAHSGRGAITNGLIYAYNAGWNNRYKAIAEGATFIATKYIYSGQQNQYLQKFNVNPSSIYSFYSHQYQTNIQAPTVEGTYVYWGYKDSGNIDKPIVFQIPVYNNMKTEVPQKPVDGNPNNWLTSISIDGKSISNHTDSSGNEVFDGDIYYSYNNNWDNTPDATYTSNVINYNVAYNKDKIKITTTQAVSTSKVSGAGEVALKNKVNTIDIVVTAENRTTKTYRLIVTKDDAPVNPPTDTDDNSGGNSSGNQGNNESGSSSSTTPTVPEKTYTDISTVLNKVSIKYNKLYMYGLTIGTTYDNFKNAIKKQDSSLTITITKNSNNNSGTFATGDKITINNGKDTNTYTYVLYGDLNGDAKTNILDLIHIRNIILEQSNLSGSYKEAGDINHDGKSNILDLILVRNDILGQTIKQ